MFDTTSIKFTLTLATLLVVGCGPAETNNRANDKATTTTDTNTTTEDTDTTATTDTDTTTTDTDTTTTDTDTTDTDTGSPGMTCPSQNQFDEISSFIDDLISNAAILITHPSQAEAVGTLVVPGWNVSQANFFFLFMPCSGPNLYSEWCDGAACWQTECVNPGASWTQHSRLNNTPVNRNGWVYGAGRLDVLWVDGPPDFNFDVDGIATDSQGDDYSYTGGLSSIGTVLDINLEFPGVLGTGEIVTAHANVDTNGGIYSGEAWVDGVQVADLFDTGNGFRFVGNAVCP